MAVSYTISIDQLEALPQQGDLQNVVQAVHWTLTATDGAVSESMQKVVHLQPATAETFVPFDTLQESQVKQWVIDAVGDRMTTLENTLAEKLSAVSLDEPRPVSVPWS